MKKPLLGSGATMAITDGNYNPILFTAKQALIKARELKRKECKQVFIREYYHYFRWSAC